MEDIGAFLRGLKGPSRTPGTRSACSGTARPWVFWGAAWWTSHGRPTGELPGAPPSRVGAAFEGVDIRTMRGGELLEQRHAVDVASPMAQIGW